MTKLSRFARCVLGQAGQNKVALDADIWTELPIYDEGIDEFRVRRVAWCPFVDVMKVAQNTQDRQRFHIP